MPLGVGDALSIGGGLAGALGSSKNKPGGAVSGFDSLPDLVKKAWIDEGGVVPEAQRVYKQGYQSIPMKRAYAPQTPFDSQALFDLQKYSDARGGYFSPLDETWGNKDQNTDQAKDAAANKSAEDALRNEMLARMFLQSGVTPQGEKYGLNGMRSYENAINLAGGANQGNLSALGQWLQMSKPEQNKTTLMRFLGIK